MRPHLSANCTQPGRRRWWRGEEGARHPGPEAQVLRHFLWHVLQNALRRILYVPALHVSTATVTGPAAPTRASDVQRARDDEETVVDRVRVAAQQHAFFGFRRSKVTRSTMNTFTLPSFAAPGFRRMKIARAKTSTMVAAAAAVVVTSLARGGEGGDNTYEGTVYRDRFEPTPQVSK